MLLVRDIVQLVTNKYYLEGYLIAEGSLDPSEIIASFFSDKFLSMLFMSVVMTAFLAISTQKTTSKTKQKGDYKHDTNKY
ncbi:hypothetical protein [Paenibacillus qinlingensis]|uniref:Uncharacterized protein n=1 Tax=Paenibacillus qinlingensis TaxID=1837343 RepID=A0ABU1P0I8_9BACL|nr:hypothetical protein [Paenibacillus qinlingensis]MDR6553225.1 hypothetical protein [Paenibacillus qinlingensis]